MCIIIDGKKIARIIKDEITLDINKLKQQNINPPKLAVILSNNDYASSVYVRNKINSCKEVGIESLLLKLESPTFEEIYKLIKDLNEDSTIDGILVQLPLPHNIISKTMAIFDIISPKKDVDVFNPLNVGLLMQNRPNFIPCTPQGIQKLLNAYNISFEGKKVAVINRSNIVGKPLFSLLIQDMETANATVTVCHDKTPTNTLKEITLSADIVIVAVGIPNFLNKDMIKENAVVVDVGINRIDGKITGDCCDNIKEKAYAITPVPGGVGPMTVAMLLKNTFKAMQLNRNSYCST